MRNLKITVGNLTTFMDSQNYDIFRNVMEFITKSVDSEEQIKDLVNKVKKMEKEKKKFGDDAILKNI